MGIKILLICTSFLLFSIVTTNESNVLHNNNVFPKKNRISLDIDSPFKINLKQVEVYETNDDVLIGTINPIYVDLRNRVYIGDADQTKIHVFEPNGDFLTSLGKEGRGPGDYSAISFRTTIISDSKFLYITDTRFFNPRRANVYKLEDHSFSHTIKLHADNLSKYDFLKGYSPVKVFPNGNGSFLVPYSQTIKNASTGTGFIYYLMQNVEGDIISEPFYKQQGISYLIEPVRGKGGLMEVMHTFPFHTKSLFSPSTKGNYYVARTDEFKIDVIDKEGTIIRTIEYPFNNKKLDIDKLIKRYEEINYMPQLGEGRAVEMLKKAKKLPDQWPALESMLVDNENRLWISTIVEDSSIYEWWVLEPTGEIITKFKWPKKRRVQQIQNDYLYTKEKDDEGADIVVKYKIEFKKRE